MNSDLELVPAFESVIEFLAERGYAISTDFLPATLPADLLKNIRLRQSQGRLQPAGIGHGTAYVKDDAIRRDAILWIEQDTQDPVEHAFVAHIQHFIHYLNRSCYTGLRESEFHYAHYAKGSFYKRHIDRFRSDDARKYSIVCYLNPQWQPGDGGELVIYPEQGPELLVEPRAGTVVIFDSGRLPHEVRVAHQDRWSVTGWLRG